MKAIKNIRLRDYDYSSDGYYFVTICTNYSRAYLKGKIKSVVVRFIGQIPSKFPGISVDTYIIMPDHIHLILVLQNSSLTLSEIIRRFKAITSKETGLKLWQPNFYEHIIRDEKALSKIREYIVNNPLAKRIEFEQFYKRAEPDKSGNYNCSCPIYGAKRK